MEENKTTKKATAKTGRKPSGTGTKQTSATKKTATKRMSLPAQEKKSAVEKKVSFQKDDLIPCTSLFAGTCVLNGKRTGNIYIWDALGEVQEVEYQDLMSEILNKRSSFIYDPLIMVGNEDVYKGRKEIESLYKHVYTEEDIEQLMSSKDTAKIKKIIRSMPAGILQSTKSMITTLIQDGRITNYKSVKAVDDELGTDIAKQFELFS